MATRSLTDRLAQAVYENGMILLTEITTGRGAKVGQGPVDGLMHFGSCRLRREDVADLFEHHADFGEHIAGQNLIGPGVDQIA
jgi:hypothetical protein